MSMWDQSIDRLVRISDKDYGLKVPFAGVVGLCALKGGGEDWYRDFSIRLTRASDNGCCDAPCSCCDTPCCCCGDEKPAKKNDFDVVYRAMSFTDDGCLYFRMDDTLFDRGAGRYEGMLQRGSGKGCEYDELCPFVLMIDSGICLDWGRAKGVALDPSKLGGCD